MKAIVVTNGEAKAKVALRDVPKPVPAGRDEVLFRVLCVGMDGTDREIISDDFATLPEGKDEMVIGHEVLGIVEEAGTESGLSRGDFVTALVRRPCASEACINCRSGEQDFCQTGEYTERGIKAVDGYLCEYVVEKAEYVVKLPEACAPFGMLVEPQSIVEKVWNETLIIQQRMTWKPRRALVLGSGPLGLLAALTCRVHGIETHVWSKSDAESLNADIVRRIGGRYRQAGSYTEGAFLSGLTEYAKQLNISFDMIWECSGYAPLGFEAIPLLNRNGILALLGVTPGRGRLDLPSDTTYREMVLKNKCIIGSVNASRHDFETGIDRLLEMERQFPGVLELLQTNRMTIEDVPGLNFADISIKAVVDLIPPSEWFALRNGRLRDE